MIATKQVWTVYEVQRPYGVQTSCGVDASRWGIAIVILTNDGIGTFRCLIQNSEKRVAVQLKYL